MELNDPRQPVLRDFYALSNEQHDRVGVHHSEHDWNWRSIVVLGRLNVVFIIEMTLFSHDLVCIKQLSNIYNQCP